MRSASRAIKRAETLCRLIWNTGSKHDTKRYKRWCKCSSAKSIYESRGHVTVTSRNDVQVQLARRRAHSEWVVKHHRLAPPSCCGMYVQKYLPKTPGKVALSREFAKFHIRHFHHSRAEISKSEVTPSLQGFPLSHLLYFSL